MQSVYYLHGAGIHLEMLRLYEEFRFYLWASQMVNSGVVAIDFAPDEGWIDTP